jgi:GNAT superfamily N-acetyltransferase
MHQVRRPKHPNMKNLGEIVIRAAGRGDEEEILRCLAAAFEPYRAEYTPQAYADTVLDQASLKKRLQQMHVLVAVASEEIVGTVAASLLNGEGHLRGMAVRPEWRGSGLSALLLRTIETWVESQGCKRVTLDTVLPLQAAIRFYEKNGYRKSGRVSDLYGMPLVDYVKEIG